MSATDRDAAAARYEGRLALGLASREGLRWAVADVAGPLEEARRRLDLSPIAAVAFGRVMATAALLLRFTTDQLVKLVVEVIGDGPLGKLMVEIDRGGGLRGLVGEPHVPTPADGSMAVGWAVGSGNFQVTRETRRGRYVSQVALVTGEIGTDLAHYLEQSEQIRSAALVGVLPRADGIAAAGGLLVEALPGTEEDVLTRLEANIAELDGVSPLLEAGGVEALADGVLAGFDRRPDESHALRYRCGCDAETLRGQLAGLPADDLDEVLGDQGVCEAVCAFCGNRYAFTADQLGQ